MFDTKTIGCEARNKKKTAINKLLEDPWKPVPNAELNNNKNNIS